MAVAFVNNTNGSSDASSTTLPTTAASHTTGNLLVACSRHEGSPTTCVFSDTATNTWTPLGSISRGVGDMHIYFAYAKNVTGNASNIVTATFGAARTWRRLTVDQFSGLDTASPVDGSIVSAVGNTGEASAGNITTSGNGVVWCGIASYFNDFFSAGSGYTASWGSDLNLSSQYQLTAAGTFATACTNYGADWAELVVAFKEAGAGASVDPGVIKGSATVVGNPFYSFG